MFGSYLDAGEDVDEWAQDFVAELFGREPVHMWEREVGGAGVVYEEILALLPVRTEASFKEWDWMF